MTDIQSRRDVITLVETFYTSVRTNVEIGHI